jgi:hypothetical protein
VPSPSIEIETLHPTRGASRLVIEGDSLTIGTAAHCEVQLHYGEAAEEHVRIERTDEGLVARALATQPHVAMIDGLPLTQHPLLPMSVVAIGDLRVTASESEAPGAKTSKGPNSDGFKLSPVSVIAGVLAVGAAIFFAVATPPGGISASDSGGLVAPPLFSAESKCPRTDRASAGALAEQLFLEGETQRERAPFRVQSGIEAVASLESSAACYDMAGNQRAALAIRKSAEALRKEIAVDYQAHRLRLDHALATGNGVDAHREATLLLALTSHVDGEYVDWLRSTQRRVSMRIAGE